MDEQNQTNPSENTPVTPPPAPNTNQPHTPPPTTEQKHTSLMAALAYILFFVPLLTDYKDDPFVKFHVKQGLVLFLALLASAVVMRLPILGWILMFPLNVFLLIVWLMGIYNALTGKQKHLPLIGEFGESFKF
ncbi:MAG: hypothetical protein KBC69_00210 [Candidatus Magasanikbacteria bacterium]|nr:hypothetical protein [Candidatus Magasanikbacteria bacterium]